MKKLILSLGMFFLIGSLALGQAATFSIEAVGQAEPESIVTFQIKCNEIDDEVSTFQWFFVYDTIALEPIDVVNYHKDFPAYEWMNNLQYASNMIILTWLSVEARNQPMKTNEVICELQFKYLGGATELKWAKSNEVSNTDKTVFTAMWTDVGKAYYLKLYNAKVGFEE